MTPSTPLPRRATPPKRVALTHRRLDRAQKLELCEFSRAHPRMDQLELAIWAANHFHLALPLGIRTVSRILNSYGELREMTPEELRLKRRSNEAQRRFDVQLRDWILSLTQQGLRVTGDMIKHEAATRHAHLHEEGLRPIKFSNGWLTSFLGRNGIPLRNLHSSGASERSQTPKKKQVTTTTKAPKRSTVTPGGGAGESSATG